jgi:hypothetical protein
MPLRAFVTGVTAWVVAVLVASGAGPSPGSASRPVGSALDVASALTGNGAGAFGRSGNTPNGVAGDPLAEVKIMREFMAQAQRPLGGSQVIPPGGSQLPPGATQTPPGTIQTLPGAPPSTIGAPPPPISPPAAPSAPMTQPSLPLLNGAPNRGRIVE